MNIVERVELLRERHKQIDNILCNELLGPAVDPVRVSELKKSKLKIKDEMKILRRRK